MKTNRVLEEVGCVLSAWALIAGTLAALIVADPSNKKRNSYEQEGSVEGSNSRVCIRVYRDAQGNVLKGNVKRSPASIETKCSSNRGE